MELHFSRSFPEIIHRNCTAAGSFSVDSKHETESSELPPVPFYVEPPRSGQMQVCLLILLTAQSLVLQPGEGSPITSPN